MSKNELFYRQESAMQDPATLRQNALKKQADEQQRDASKKREPIDYNKMRKYTIVLDLDETLVHFKESRYLSDD